MRNSVGGSMVSLERILKTSKVAHSMKSFPSLMVIRCRHGSHAESSGTVCRDSGNTGNYAGEAYACLCKQSGI